MRKVVLKDLQSNTQARENFVSIGYVLKLTALFWFMGEIIHESASNYKREEGSCYKVNVEAFRWNSHVVPTSMANCTQVVAQKPSCFQACMLFIGVGA